MSKLVKDSALQKILSKLYTYISTTLVKSSEISDVAKSGSYSDLSNTPDLSVYATTTYVDTSITHIAARFITNSSSSAFITKSEFDTAIEQGELYYAGEKISEVTANDYTVILSDESKNDSLNSNYTTFTTTTQYVGSYVIGTKGSVLVTDANKNNPTELGINIVPGTTKSYKKMSPMTRWYAVKNTSGTVVWQFQYIVNNTTFTDEQWAAVNSGVTSTKVGGYDSHVANNSIHVNSDEKSWMETQMKTYWQNIFKNSWSVSNSYLQTPTYYYIDQYKTVSLEVTVTTSLAKKGETTSVLTDAKSVPSNWTKKSTGTYTRKVSGGTTALIPSATFTCDKSNWLNGSTIDVTDVSKSVGAWSSTEKYPIWYGWIKDTQTMTVANIFALINSSSSDISFTKSYSDVSNAKTSYKNPFTVGAVYFALTHGTASFASSISETFLPKVNENYSFTDGWSSVSYNLYVTASCDGSGQFDDVALTIKTK